MKCEVCGADAIHRVQDAMEKVTMDRAVCYEVEAHFFCESHVRPAKTFTPLTEEIMVEPERLAITIGTLVIDVDAMGFGNVLLDGKRVAIRGADIKLRVGEPAKVSLTIGHSTLEGLVSKAG